MVFGNPPDRALVCRRVALRRRADARKCPPTAEGFRSRDESTRPSYPWSGGVQYGSKWLLASTWRRAAAPEDPEIVGSNPKFDTDG